MAKLNIKFNNADYQIDESALSSAATELKSHLSSVMNGSGATINFGGTTYNIDSTKLSTARDALIAHLGTVSGNGYKVVVNGAEYSVGSGKVAGAVAELETILGDLHSEDGDAVATLAPGLYETGAIALYEAGDVEAASAMMVSSWDELEASGVIAVSEGVSIELPEMNKYGFYYGVPYSVSLGIDALSVTFNA